MSSIETKYQKLSQIEHILKRPGMYIGPVEPSTQLTWVYNNSKNRMVQKNIKYSPGLYKLLDEILMNALDETTRDNTLKNIKVSVFENTGKISVFNDGKGIEVVMHPKYKIYVPELIFSHLLTSTSYDSSKVSTAAGTHGLGAKLTAIFSKHFEVDVGDPKNKKRFFQTYSKNLSEKSKAQITPYSGASGYVKITFIPDYKKFSLDNIDKNHIALIQKRIYDVAGISPSNVNVFFNNTKIPINSFSEYVNLYIGSEEKAPRVVEKCGDRWTIILAPSMNDKFEQISFVNGIYTSIGGKHVNYITEQVNDFIYEYIKKKYKGINIREAYIRDRYMIFIKTTIENPTFSSQTKEEMTSQPEKFGSTCILSKTFYSKIVANLPIITDIVNFIKAKEMKDFFGKDTKKKSTLRSIPKLDDANFAGTNKSEECILILTEGDSAKTMAVSGIGAIPKGRNIFGVFPLKGKLLNTREANNKQISNNDEIINLRKIIGFQPGKKYTKDNINELRYGKIMIMTDADVDGSHIKGLFFNFVHHLFPTLLEVDGFLTALVTPVVKVTKGNEIISFDNLTKFEEWKANTDSSKWKIKYYKGLGTNTTAESKEYFKNLDKYTRTYKWDENTNKAIELAFSKQKIEERKSWLRKYNREAVIPNDMKKITFTDFIHKDLIHFSNYDNLRSIPVMIDGLKPSQRKVLYAGFKKNLQNDIKVSQFVGYISEHSAYHHGEMSLINTIIGMAQDFVGSNNINLYIPSGQFGTRLQGGKDHSSARYIFTRLNKIARLIFHPHDDPILAYNEDDGMKVEPEYYVPIIPISLVNGAEGIGTGFSTFIPHFSAKEIIEELKNRIKAGGNSYKWQQLKPSYKNNKGKIEKLDNQHYISKGSYKITDKKIEITELPVGVWSNDYKRFLEEITFGGDRLFSGLENYCTESTVHFVMKIKDRAAVSKMERELTDIKSVTKLEKKLKLVKPISLTNMYLYNNKNILNKYNKIDEILEEFYVMRLSYYHKRKEFRMKVLKEELDILESKVRFIKDIISKKLDLANKEKDAIIKILEGKKLYKIKGEATYDYLLRMPFYSLTKAKVTELNKQYDDKKKEYDTLNKKKPADLWVDDLNVLIAFMEKYLKRGKLTDTTLKGQNRIYRKTARVPCRNWKENSANGCRKVTIVYGERRDGKLRYMYNPFIETCQHKYPNAVLKVASHNVYESLGPSDTLIVIGMIGPFPNFKNLRKRGVYTIIFWTEPYVYKRYSDEIWYYSKYLTTLHAGSSFQHILVKDEPMIDYSQFSKNTAKLVFLGNLQYRTKEATNIMRSIPYFIEKYDLFTKDKFDSFLVKEPHIYVSICKRGTRVLPSARINRLLSSGAIIISQHCNPVDDALYKDLIWFCSLNEIHDTSKMLMEKSPSELNELSQTIKDIAIKRFA